MLTKIILCSILIGPALLSGCAGVKTTVGGIGGSYTSKGGQTYSASLGAVTIDRTPSASPTPAGN